MIKTEQARAQVPQAQAARAARQDQRAQRALVDRHAPAGEIVPVDPTTLDVGALAEQRAVERLEREGYAIVHRNYRCDAGELDIVAVEDEVMVFVEVRSRADDEHGGAIESVNRRKQRQVTKVAEVYLVLENPPYEEFRFDVVTVTGRDHEEVEIYRDAWRGGLL
jgi:putative endonuclease